MAPSRIGPPTILLCFGKLSLRESKAEEVEKSLPFSFVFIYFLFEKTREYEEGKVYNCKK
jgi:hypothetical protein